MGQDDKSSFLAVNNVHSEQVHSLQTSRYRDWLALVAHVECCEQAAGWASGDRQTTDRQADRRTSPSLKAFFQLHGG